MFKDEEDDDEGSGRRSRGPLTTFTQYDEGPHKKKFSVKNDESMRPFQNLIITVAIEINTHVVVFA